VIQFRSSSSHVYVDGLSPMLRLAPNGVVGSVDELRPVHRAFFTARPLHSTSAPHPFLGRIVHWERGLAQLIESTIPGKPAPPSKECRPRAAAKESSKSIPHSIFTASRNPFRPSRAPANQQILRIYPANTAAGLQPLAKPPQVTHP